MPKPLVVDIRDQSQALGSGGPARVGTLDGGLFFSQIGSNLPEAGGDPNQLQRVFPYGNVIRFRGQLYVGAIRGPDRTSTFHGRIWPYDEGGIDDWVDQVVTGGVDGNKITAKGGKGVNVTFSNQIGAGPLHVIVTENQDFLVESHVQEFGAMNYTRYDPDNGPNGSWVGFQALSAGDDENTVVSFVHDGLLFSVDANGGAYRSYDPLTPAAETNYAFGVLGFPLNGGCFFTLYDRLFFQGNDRADVNPYVGGVAEFLLGAWTATGLTPALGSSDAEGATSTAFRLSPTQVLVIGGGGGHGASPGLKAFLFTTVGDSSTGALQVSDETDPVIPAALRAGTLNQGSTRCFGFASTDDPLGVLRHFMYYMPDAVGATSAATLFEITDELTEMTNLGAPQADSNFAFPGPGFYGGGEKENGIDQSTRLVTCSPRGWEKGTTGLVVKIGAHGDGPVLAHEPAGALLRHGVVTSGPFTVGETLTGADSGATGTVAGVGSSGVSVLPLAGTFVGGEVVTGGTSSASAILNLDTINPLTGGGNFSVAETLTGGASSATAVVVSVGTRINGRVSVEVSTIAGGPFTAGEVISGGTSGDTATLDSPTNLPPFAFLPGESMLGLTSGATAVLAGDGAAEGLYVREVVGTFVEAETVVGQTSGGSAVLEHVLLHGTVTAGPFQVGETVTGGTSNATGVVRHLGLGGAGEQLVKVDTVAGGPFLDGEVITGGTSNATATLSAAPRGFHGGAADKTIRARYYFSAVGPSGKGVPLTGFCTMVAGSGVKGTVSKGTGPGGSDQLINVVADAGVGGDTPASFEWDFLADGVPQFVVSNLSFEIDRV